MRILTPDRKYIIFWGIVEIVAISPFYYFAYKVMKGWPTMVWGKDTQEKRDAQELDLRRKLMATDKKATKEKGNDKGSKKDKS